MESIDRLDLFRGLLAGHFLGDALGAPHEFWCNRKTPYTGKLEHPAFLNSRAGRKESGIGQFTDDSEMTLTLMRTILSMPNLASFNTSQLILAYMEWANSGTWCLGKNTRNLLGRIKTLRGYENHKLKMKPQNESNGSLMRCSPLALLPKVCRDYLVAEDTAITHNAAVALEVNIAYLDMLSTALSGESRDQILTIGRQAISSASLEEAYYQAINNQAREVSGKDKGWLVHAFYWVIWVVKWGESYTSVMQVIITAGGDTDTNAAIAGAMMGAILGYRQLWAEEEENIIKVLGFPPDTGPNPRPAKYLANDFMDLTQNWYNYANQLETLS